MHRGAVEWGLRVHRTGTQGTPPLGPKGDPPCSFTFFCCVWLLPGSEIPLSIRVQLSRTWCDSEKTSYGQILSLRDTAECNSIGERMITSLLPCRGAGGTKRWEQAEPRRYEFTGSWQARTKPGLCPETRGLSKTCSAGSGGTWGLRRLWRSVSTKPNMHRRTPFLGRWPCQSGVACGDGSV